MIYSSTFDKLKEHYKLDELYADRDFDKPHTSPCGKYTEYEYKVFVRKGDVRFTFFTAVHWEAHVTKVSWREFWVRIFIGDEIRRYSVDHEADAEYVMHMVIEGLEQAKGRDDE